MMDNNTNHNTNNVDTSIENVLILQGGGSLGAYECGVYKTLVRNNIKFDVVAGTSIEALNAAIIVGTKNNDPVRDPEDFWLTAAGKITPSFLPDNIRPSLSVIDGSIYGNINIFVPRWIFPHEAIYYSLTTPYLYDLTPLKRLLCEFIDFTRLDKVVKINTILSPSLLLLLQIFRKVNL